MLTATLGCSVLQPRSAGPGKGEEAWREFSSGHFVLCTDAAGDDARESLAELETIYETLRSILFSDDAGAAPVHVVLFVHTADLQRFIPSGTIAAFVPPLPGDPESHATMLLETSLSDEARRVFLHETTHAFIRRSFSPVPIWLNEGLATYFETMRIESGRVVLGEPIEAFAMPANMVPSLFALLTADAATFYAGGNAHSVEGLHQQSSFYAASWNLVHMLMHGKEEYRNRFQDFLEALKRREPAERAWRRMFDEETSRKLARDYLEYLRSDLDAGFVPIDVHRVSKVNAMERIMAPEEVRTLLSSLSRRGGRRPAP
jgi:hypothetical protein